MERTAVVTGGAGGIGRWVALGLARAGHRVVLVGRDHARGDAARAWIADRVPGAATEFAGCDLSSLAATRALGRGIADRYGTVSVLVNNAGVFRARREDTAEGHEAVLATNHLSPFVLTRALDGALRAGAPSRIVNVGSSISDRARVAPEDLQLRRSWGMVRAYGQSKLAMLMVTMEWADRLRGSGVVANTVHPGAVATGLVRTPGVIGLAWRAMAPFLLTEEQGADTPLHAALAPEMEAVTGAYLKRRRPVAPNRLALDPALRARVWAETERLAGG